MRCYGNTSQFSPFNEDLELKLNKNLRPLVPLGCDYFYFLVLDDKDQPNTRYCSHENWLDFYHEENMSHNDPLKRIAEGSPSIVIPWQQISHMNRQEKTTMSGRASFGLFNGLTIVQNINDKKYILVLATETADHDLSRFLLIENSLKLETFVHGCVGDVEYLRVYNS